MGFFMGGMVGVVVILLIMGVRKRAAAVTASSSQALLRRELRARGLHLRHYCPPPPFMTPDFGRDRAIDAALLDAASSGYAVFGASGEMLGSFSQPPPAAPKSATSLRLVYSRP